MSKPSNSDTEEEIIDTDRASIAIRVSVVSLFVNLILSILKLVIGLIAHSGAMVSDAVHSFSDVFSTIIVMIGVSVARAEVDDDHQYGHERLEYVASLTLAILLILAGLGIGIGGIRQIFAGETPQVPGWMALAAAVISIGSKEWMYWYTRFYAKKIDSGALMADAWHHRSDAFSSIGALIGIAGARCGYPILDPLASVVICLFIVFVGIKLFREATDKLSDASCSPQLTAEMSEIVKQQKGVMAIDMIKSRQFGTRLFVDIEIAADGNLTLRESHRIAEKVHDAIESHFTTVKHCTIHVNPYFDCIEDDEQT